jgi:hypothetical protein
LIVDLFGDWQALRIVHSFMTVPIVVGSRSPIHRSPQSRWSVYSRIHVCNAVHAALIAVNFFKWQGYLSTLLLLAVAAQIRLLAKSDR